MNTVKAYFRETVYQSFITFTLLFIYFVIGTYRRTVTVENFNSYYAIVYRK